MTHTDINIKGWIGRLPPWAQPYALLMRLDRPVGTWLLLLPGWWAILLAGATHTTTRTLDLLILFGVGALAMRAAGCIVNDLWDRELDQHVSRTRTRPLASGALSVRQALGCLLVLLLIGLAVLRQMNLLTILLGVLSLGFIALYPYMKRITWWPQAFLGLTFNFGALMGWSAATGTLGLPALLLYGAGFFWTLGYDTIYAHQDREDDMRVGIKSSALWLGERAWRWVAGFYALCWGMLALGFIAGGAGTIALALLAGAGGHFIWQMWRWNPDDPQSALRIFRANRDFGLLVAAAALAALFGF